MNFTTLASLALLVSSLSLVACATPSAADSAADNDVAANGDALALFTTGGGAPVRLVCKPRPERSGGRNETSGAGAFSAIHLRLDPMHGFFSYSITTSAGDEGESASTQLGDLFSKEAPPHGLAVDVREGFHETRTDGMHFISLKATGGFLRGGSFRTPEAALADAKQVTASFTSYNNVYLDSLVGVNGEVDLHNALGGDEGLVLCTRE